jgi:tetratricopeptide (TPR) repeat protein
VPPPPFPPSHAPPARRLRERPPPPPVRRPQGPLVPELRLAIGPAGLGIELARPALLGCVTVAELAVAIPGVRFPLDVSGGVSRFRHRRGRLQRLTVELDAGSLARWLRPRFRGVIGTGVPLVWVSVRAAGVTLGVFESADTGAAPRILAFDVALDSQGEDLRFWIHGARGSGLPSPAALLAIQAVNEAVGTWTTREGSAFVARGVPRAIARALLPDAGVRAPDASGVRFTGLGAEADGWLLLADDAGARADVTAEATRAREGAVITRATDDLLFAGDLDGARASAVAALERAPRHRELCRRIADIDRVAGGRAEAALATMVDADRRDAELDGLLVAELLAEVGDTDAAIASMIRLGETEPVAPLAARALERAAELTTDPHDALVWLDMAIARGPAVTRIRWSRLARRLSAGRVEDALADAEHLEAQASGTLARHAVWKHAGEAWGNAGRAAESAALYERALRFDPRDPEAFAGLGRALLASHREARGTSLLARAADLAAAEGDPAPGLVLELAVALAETMDDRPAAIARVRTIASDSAEGIRARGLEGRWRAELGDVAGASFAFARMRELTDVRVSGKGGPDARAAAALLVEAAGFEQGIREDLLAAQRHLASALRLAPEDPIAREAYREVGLRVAGLGPSSVHPRHERAEDARHQRAEDARPTDLPPGFGQDEAPGPTPAAAPFDIGFPSERAPEPVDEAEDAARVEDLTRKLQADPSDDSVVDELSERLLRLGRTHELLALLSARIEDAAPARRVALLPKQREVLQRLIQEARQANRNEEASLFEDLLASLPG